MFHIAPIGAIKQTTGSLPIKVPANSSPNHFVPLNPKGPSFFESLHMAPRAKPFSGKQKKQQLQEKRQRKKQEEVGVPLSSPLVQTNKSSNPDQKLISEWDTKDSKISQIKYTENPKYTEILSGVLDESSVKVNIGGFYKQTSIEIPSRPPWSNEMSKEELEESEGEYFKGWINHVYEQCPSENLGYFEHNLEVWRQFWRVCEISDIIIIVLDIRFPILHFPMSLFRYLKHSISKPFILALMKCDLIHEDLVNCWRRKLLDIFGDDTKIVGVSIYHISTDEESHQSVKRGSKRYFDSTGVDQILEACREILGNKYSNEWNNLGHSKDNDPIISELDTDSTNPSHDYLTIGTLGHPNVGKSSLINSIVGKKVVSASRTPGHTKHFQTIHLSKHIRLCDCPGLIFPVSLSTDLQILNGLYNIAQVKDPFGPLSIASTLIDLPTGLKLDKSLREHHEGWTVLSICEEFAIQKGFYTSKAGRPDVYRAANLILRMILEGRILIAWKPDDYKGPILRPLTKETESTNESLSDKSPSEEEELSTTNYKTPNLFDFLREE